VIPFDRVVLSTNNDPRYMEFAKITPHAWRKFFPECEVQLVQALRQPDTPSGSLAKLVRYSAASAGDPNEVCLIHDIDTVPLQRQYTMDLLGQRKPGHLFCVGREVYDGTPDEGKFPAGHMTGEGHLFKALLKGYVPGLPSMFDDKEDVRSHDFSDESMVRAQLARHPEIPVQHVERGLDIRHDWIDRSWWNIDREKLWAGGYVECNMLRPWSAYPGEMQPVVDYLRGDK